MLYLSAPNGDGTFFDFVSEDVLRVFGTKAYLNTESVKEMISELTEENRIDEEENENVLQAADSITEDWIGLVGSSIGLDEFKYDDFIGVFSGLAAAHDDIWLKSHSLKLFNACLCRLCFQLLRSRQIRDQGNMNQHRIVAANLMLELTDRL